MPAAHKQLGTVSEGRVRKSWPKAIHFPNTRKPKPIKLAHSRSKGFANQSGVSCYRNALLQTLLHVPELLHYLCREERCDHPGDGCVFCALRALALHYWSSTEATFVQQRVQDVDAAMRLHPARNPGDGQQYGFLARPNDQQDAHEYFAGIVNMLKHVNNHRIDGVKNVAVDRLFEIVYKRSWTCSDCGKVHLSGDRNVGMSVPMAPPRNVRSLETYIAEYFAPESLEIRCDSDLCQGNSADRVRRTAIATAPEVLVIQMVRMAFTIDRKTKSVTMSKVMSRVPYGEVLDLWPHTEPVSAERNKALKYQLRGVVSHQGSRLTSGHYIATVRFQNGQDFARVNDSVPIVDLPKDKARVLSAAEGRNFQSYLLVYQKIGGEMAKRI